MAIDCSRLAGTVLLHVTAMQEPPPAPLGKQPPGFGPSPFRVSQTPKPPPPGFSREQPSYSAAPRETIKEMRDPYASPPPREMHTADVRVPEPSPAQSYWGTAPPPPPPQPEPLEETQRVPQAVAERPAVRPGPPNQIPIAYGSSAELARAELPPTGQQRQALAAAMSISAPAPPRRILARESQTSDPYQRQLEEIDPAIPTILLQAPYVIHWQVQADSGDNSWYDYSLPFSKMLEENYRARREPFEYTPGRHKSYLYDTQGMVQINTWERTKRVMRRVYSILGDYLDHRQLMRQVKRENKETWDAQENRSWSSSPWQGGGWQPCAGGKGSGDDGKGNWGGKGGKSDHHGLGSS